MVIVPYVNEIKKNSAQVISLIDEMNSCGTKRIAYVGGEVLLRDDFEQIADHTRKYGICVTMCSNGHLIPKNMRIIKKLDGLILSFDRKQKKMGIESHAPKGYPNIISHGMILACQDRLNARNPILNAGQVSCSAISTRMAA